MSWHGVLGSIWRLRVRTHCLLSAKGLHRNREGAIDAWIALAFPQSRQDLRTFFFQFRLNENVFVLDPRRSGRDRRLQ